MSEFWVSRKKWTCKYCDITINDDVPSRQQHENGLRHKGNVERHLRQAYKKSERDRKEERDAKREMEKIEKLAQQSYAKDVVGGDIPNTKAISPEPSSSKSAIDRPTKVAKAWKPTNKLAAYGSALPLVTQDDEEIALKEWQEKQEAKSKVGEAGTWQVVSAAPLTSSIVGQQHNADTTERDARIRFDRQKKGVFRDDEDDISSADIVVKKRIKVHSEAEMLRQAEEEKRKEVPSWKPMRIDAGISVKNEGPQTVPVVRIETQEIDLRNNEAKEEKVQLDTTAETIESPPVANSTSMFKKRKAGAGAGAKRVRAVI